MRRPSLATTEVSTRNGHSDSDVKMAGTVHYSHFRAASFPQLVSAATESTVAVCRMPLRRRHGTLGLLRGPCDPIGMRSSRSTELSDFATAVSVRAVGRLSTALRLSHASAHSQSTTSCTFSARAVDVVMYRNSRLHSHGLKKGRICAETKLSKVAADNAAV